MVLFIIDFDLLIQIHNTKTAFEHEHWTTRPGQARNYCTSGDSFIPITKYFCIIFVD